jgi:hypothetical protein
VQFGWMQGYRVCARYICFPAPLYTLHPATRKAKSNLIVSGRGVHAWGERADASGTIATGIAATDDGAPRSLPRRPRRRTPMAERTFCASVVRTWSRRR